MLDLKQNHLNSLDILLKKLAFKQGITQDDIYLGLGSKWSKNATLFNVDYIFAFDISSNFTQTIISWSIAVINFDLCDIFKPLLNRENNCKVLWQWI